MNRVLAVQMKLIEEKKSLIEEVEHLKGKVQLMTTNMKKQAKDLETLQEKLADRSDDCAASVNTVSTPKMCKDTDCILLRLH